MRILRMLLVLMLPSCLLVLAAPAPPAAACSCVSGDASLFAEWADTVFIGALDEVVMPPEAPQISSVDPVTYEFDVSAVYEGEATERTHVRSVRFGASCGLEGLEVGQTYVVFASHKTIDGEPSDMLWASLCGGTAPASEKLVTEVESVLGSAAPPEPGEPAPPPAPISSFAAFLLSWAGTTVKSFLEALS